MLETRALLGRGVPIGKLCGPGEYNVLETRALWGRGVPIGKLAVTRGVASGKPLSRQGVVNYFFL